MAFAQVFFLGAYFHLFPYEKQKDLYFPKFLMLEQERKWIILLEDAPFWQVSLRTKFAFTSSDPSLSSCLKLYLLCNRTVEGLSWSTIRSCKFLWPDSSFCS